MSIFQSSPAELLYEIFSYLRDDKHLLRNLALQCRCFSLAVRPVLLRNMAFTLQERPSILALELFHRSCKENPELAEMVQRLSLDMLRVEGSAKANVHETVGNLLQELSALRALKFQDNSDPPCFDPAFLEVDSMGGLTSLTISDGNLTLQNMTRYMFLDKLRHLNVLWIRTSMPTTVDILGWPAGEWPFPKLSGGKKAGTSPVALLEFGPIFHLPEQVLREVLSWPKTLRRFRGTIPGEDVPRGFGVSRKLSTNLSPASISRALSPTKDSLRCLELTDTGCDWPGHDQSKMDLSDFTSLTKIDVPSTCFFKKCTYGVKRQGMYALLPLPLVDLRITYDLDDCIRPNERELAEIPTSLEDAENTSEDISEQFTGLEVGSPSQAALSLKSPKDLKWLMELAENKAQCFPKLRRVHLLERCGLLRYLVHPVNWNPPSAIQDAYSSAGIELRAVVRKTALVPTFD